MLTRKNKKPWPTQAAMVQIYSQNLWGGDLGTFYSGEGSHHPELVVPYIKAVTTFLLSFKEPLTVCDLGCGDFNIGKQLVSYTQKYQAVDIVPELISHLKTTHNKPLLSFHCLDIAKDPLPVGDCAILRQVLQHLSNAEVQQILIKLKDFKYILLTEHLPHGDFTPNKDIISGQGIRLKKQSGIALMAAPFYVKAKTVKQLAAVPLENGKGIIVTQLYKLF